MQVFPAANRLAPLLALVTAACNVSDSGISSVSQGRFAPRLVAAGGRLNQSDSVYLQLWTRSDSRAAWAPAASLGRRWSDSSIEVDALPVGALWKASIAGVTAKDTLWRGTDSGVIAAATTEQNLQDTASRMRVRNVASRPDTTGLPTSLVGGESFTLSGTGKIVHAWGSDLPDCAGGDSGRTIVVDTAHTVLRLRACGDTSLTWPSAVVTRKFSILAATTPRLSLTDSDSLLTTTPVTKMAVRAWNSAVALAHPAQTTLSWEISLDSSGQKDTGSGNSLSIPRAWLASLPATGTSFIAKAFVRLKDSTGAAVDSAHLRWLVTVPVTPTPVLSHRLSLDNNTLIHTWNTHDSATFLLKTGSTLVTEELASTVTEHRAQVKPGDICLARLIAYDSATGRRSDTARDTARVPSPPATPRFTAKNTDTTHGYVTLKIDTSNQAGTRWAYGYCDTAGGAVTYADTLAGDSAVIELNSGRWIIGVRALRDGLWRDSLCTLSVTRTLAARPGKPTGLVISGRTDSSLTWTWNHVENRKYRIFVQKSFDNLAALSADTAPKSPAPAVGNTDSSTYTAKAAPGETWTIAVIALKGTADSSGGNSDPATLATTAINPPPVPNFTAVSTSSATGALTVAVTNMGNCTGRVGISQNGTRWAWRPLTSASWDTVGLQGSYFVAVVLARDGLESGDTLKSPVTLQTTNATAPRPPTGLELQTRTASSLTWAWDTLPRHSYTAYHGIGATIPADVTNEAHAPSSGAFTYEGLSANQSAWIAVTSTSLDSTGSPSSPVELVSRTLNPPATISEASAKSFDGGIEVSYSRDSGTSYVLRCIGTTIKDYASTHSPDSLRLSEGTYKIQIIATRDGLDTSTSFSGIAVATPSQYTHKEPTGLKIEPRLQETVGDTAFDVAWDARSGVTFQLTVTPKNGSDTVQSIQGSTAHISTTPGESYHLALKVLGDKDSANPSNAITLDTLARKAPSAPLPISASWDKALATMNVLLKSADTSVASYLLTDDSAIFTGNSIITNSWSGSGSQPELALSGLSNTVRHGNMHIHITAIGKNGLSSSDMVIAAHIPQQLSLGDTTLISNWTSGHIVRTLLYPKVFTTMPASIRVSAAPADASLSNVNQSLSSLSETGTLASLDIGKHATTWTLHLDATWANGDTVPTVTRSIAYMDTSDVDLRTFVSGFNNQTYSLIDATTNSGSDYITAPPNTQYMTSFQKAHEIGFWTVIVPPYGYSQSKVDSFGGWKIVPQAGTTFADTSEFLARPYLPDSLRDQRGSTTTIYPVVTLAGHTIMAGNLGKVLQTDGVTANSGHPEYGSYFTWKAATDSGRSSQGVCAHGWHVPRRQELADLYNMSAGALVGLTDGGTNTLGFNGLSSGHYGGSTLNNSGSGGYLQMLSADVQSSNLYAVFSLKASGWASGGASITDLTSFYTVRCIKDN